MFTFFINLIDIELGKGYRGKNRKIRNMERTVTTT